MKINFKKGLKSLVTSGAVEPGNLADALTSGNYDAVIGAVSLVNYEGLGSRLFDCLWEMALSLTPAQKVEHICSVLPLEQARAFRVAAVRRPS